MLGPAVLESFESFLVRVLVFGDEVGFRIPSAYLVRGLLRDPERTRLAREWPNECPRHPGSAL